MWIKRSGSTAFSQVIIATTTGFFLMPWVAANPPQSSSSFGDYPAPCGAGISFERMGSEGVEF
jgi:hypothetical protein